jgi:hypothetical protein
MPWSLEEFVAFYYTTFDGNRPGLAALYVCCSPIYTGSEGY